MKATQSDRRQEFSTLSDYYSDNEHPNGLDFKEVNKIAKYREAITKLQRRCECLSQNNERLVRRLHYVKRITMRKRRDVDLLKGRLDVYSDEWRTAQPDPITKVKMPTNLTPTGKVRKPRLKKNNVNANANANANATANTNAQQVNATATATAAAAATDADLKQPHIDGKLSKRKRSKSDKEKDPNAPKRPANPFFQFCQEQRSILMDELNSELLPGQPELSKQELTRQLAQRWRSMEPATKQIYVNKYESSKQKYNMEMQSYKKDASNSSSINLNSK